MFKITRLKNILVYNFEHLVSISEEFFEDRTIEE